MKLCLRRMTLVNVVLECFMIFMLRPRDPRVFENMGSPVTAVYAS